MPDILPEYEFEIGANIGAMTNVETLLKAPPHPWEYFDGATEQYTAGTGHTYVDGYPQAIWHFKYLPVADYQTLEGWFGTAQSVARGIKTKDTGGTYVTKTVIMHKPVLGDTVRRGHYGYYDVVLRFTQLT